MACFLVPASEAVVTTVIEKVVRSKENKNGDLTVKADADSLKVSLSEKLGWLNRMLWGGSALLAFEHVWHGEVVPTFPFLTAVTNGETSEMLHEMGTAGVGMAVLVTAIWGCMVFASSVISKRKVATSEETQKEV